MATAPRMKPVKAAGKARKASQARRNTHDSAPAGQSTFEDALRAIQEDLAIELEEDVRACEHSTETAVDAAQPAQKLSAFHSGFDGWLDKLCASAKVHYNNCFEIALKNRLQHDYLLSLLRSDPGELKSPAGFAKGFTEVEMSAFLRVTGFDRTEPAREIGSHGRVRWFVRHIRGDLSDRYPIGDAKQETPFLLPLWFQHEWNIKASMARLAWREPGSAPGTPAIDESRRLDTEETEKFILGMQGLLVGKVRNAIAMAHRKALVVLVKNGIATEAPSMIAPVAAGRPRMPDFKSETKKAVFGRLATDHDASDRQLCDWLDETGNVELPANWARHSNRSFATAYADKKVKPLMESRFSEVRRHMRAAGYNIP